MKNLYSIFIPMRIPIRILNLEYYSKNSMKFNIKEPHIFTSCYWMVDSMNSSKFSYLFEYYDSCKYYSNKLSTVILFGIFE